MDSHDHSGTQPPPPPLPARNGAVPVAASTPVPSSGGAASAMAIAPPIEGEISPVTILPHDVIEKLAELDLELSEGESYLAKVESASASAPVFYGGLNCPQSLPSNA